MKTARLEFYIQPEILSDNSVVHDVYCRYGDNVADFIFPAESADQADRLVTALNEAAAKALDRTNL